LIVIQIPKHSLLPLSNVFTVVTFPLKFQAISYYTEALKKGYTGDFSSPGMFTSVGKPRMKTGKYNVPVGLYSDETLLELSSSGGHGFVE